MIETPDEASETTEEGREGFSNEPMNVERGRSLGSSSFTGFISRLSVSQIYR